MAHAGLYSGGTALIVLGGPSGAHWAALKERIKPDVILGANGVNGMIPDLDYWMCIENLLATHDEYAQNRTARSGRLLEMLNRTGAKTRLVHHLTYPLLENKKGAIRVNRNGIELCEMPAAFSFREYGLGYLSGSLMQRPDITASLRVGTVGLQLLHHAGILGCAKAHTIGFDLCFKGDKHHWYEHPPYEANKYWNEKMFIRHGKMNTMYFWLDTARYLKAIKPLFERDGITWVDHSKGLLNAEGIA